LPVLTQEQELELLVIEQALDSRSDKVRK
jgi:hypothetical protein